MKRKHEDANEELCSEHNKILKYDDMNNSQNNIVPHEQSNPQHDSQPCSFAPEHEEERRFLPPMMQELKFQSVSSHVNDPQSETTSLPMITYYSLLTQPHQIQPEQHPPNTWFPVYKPDPPQESVNRDQADIDEERKLTPEELEELFSKCTQQCDAEVQNCMGLAYCTGSGTFEKDYGKAMEWLLKSVDQSNNVNAMFNIGYMFECGLGREKDCTEAFEWYLMAAEQGDPEAQFTVGLFYEFGKGVERDLYQAREWYLRASSRGHSEAQKKMEFLNLQIAQQDQ